MRSRRFVGREHLDYAQLLGGGGYERRGAPPSLTGAAGTTVPSPYRSDVRVPEEANLYR